ncbi:zinc finger transcription factor [Lithospermum erythrorhizon]|uniref:Zinc finger transcription factor n=1 Tax=Lithospermum erythrorhizon TaxID=34254 RepID=A0AAV3NLK8_LITER
MSMVELNNCWDSIVNGVDSEEFANILSILDFPMESLEGDGIDGDLDPSDFQSMGSILLDSLKGVPPASQSKVDGGSEIKGASRNASINIKSELIEPENCVGNNSANTPCESFIPPKFTVRTPSPVSVLESTGSCSSVVLRKIKVQTVDHNNDSNKRRLSESSNVFVGVVNSSRQARKECPEELYPMRKKETTLHKQSASTKKCTHCQVTKTPQWREGPLGVKTLCNACGVHYRSGRLFPEYRPASSPTFVPSLHSNSHKEVIKMRKKATEQGVEAGIPSMSPSPEYVRLIP